MKKLLPLVLVFFGACASAEQDHPKPDSSQNSQGFSRGGLVVDGLIAASAEIASNRAAQCRILMRKLVTGKVGKEEGLDFLQKELKAWESEQQLLGYVEDELRKQK